MKKKNLLFMGDSITAGVYSDGKLKYNRDTYATLIRDKYKELGLLNEYYNIAVSGFTTKDVINLFESDLTYNENIAYNITPERNYKRGNYKKENTIKLISPDIKINDLIKKADKIIMTLGSNDVIKYIESHKEEFKENFDIKKIIQKEEEITLKKALYKSIVDNFKIILEHIYNCNKDVEIIFIGAYVPNKSSIINKVLGKYLGQIEDEFLDEIKDLFPGVEFLSVKEKIAENKNKYLDNPLSIHLNKEGYEAMAECYIKKFIDNK